MIHFKRAIALGAILCSFSAVLVAQEDASLLAHQDGSSSRSEISSDATPTAKETPLTAAERSRILKENLQATIDEGERVLKALPRERLRILRSRLANLARQVKRKEKERKQLQDSLATLRADYFRRLAALRGEGVKSSIAREEEKNLKADYDLHAEFFEEELSVLTLDVVEINATIEKLKARSIIEEKLRSTPRRVKREPQPSDRLTEIPASLNPFTFKSYLTMARGRAVAPRGLLLGLRAEVAYHQDELTRAATELDEILESRPFDVHQKSMTVYNRAFMDYLMGNYQGAYRIFREFFQDDASPESAYVLAVLAYMNGFMGETRQYLDQTDDASRRKIELVLGPIGPSSSR